MNKYIYIYIYILYVKMYSFIYYFNSINSDIQIIVNKQVEPYMYKYYL